MIEFIVGICVILLGIGLHLVLAWRARRKVRKQLQAETAKPYQGTPAYGHMSRRRDGAIHAASPAPSSPPPSESSSWDIFRPSAHAPLDDSSPSPSPLSGGGGEFLGAGASGSWDSGSSSSSDSGSSDSSSSSSSSD